jgi:hypothetical protein
MKKLIALGLAAFMMTTVSYAQKEEAEIKIKKIEVSLEPAPRYALQKPVPQADSSLKWLVVEAELECQPEWADEVTLKFYIVAQYNQTVRGEYVPKDGYDILATTVTVVNMKRNVGTGAKNIVPVFLDSNSVKKYGAVTKDAFIPEVAVQVMYKGKLQDTKWMKNEQRSGRFWEAKQPKMGILMNLLQSPWWPAYGDFYEQVRAAPAPMM